MQRKGSNVRIYIRGKRGQPCLVPFDMSKNSNLVSLTFTATDGLE